ncbi:alpha/beta fold hydrolase, partial [Streptomyces carpinensis]
MLAKLSTRSAARRCAAVGAVTLALLGAGLPGAAAGDGKSNLSRFYHQKVTWAACDADGPRDMQCGKVTVPLDYARPGAGTLELALARYRATGPSRGSVVLNFGGPGGAGVPTLAAGDGKPFMDLTNGYDVVTFDPRGVGQSSPVSCGIGAGSSDSGGTTSDANPDLGNAQAARKALAEWKKVATQCAQHSGPVLPHIGTVDAARDLDVIRQALGDGKLNYLGFSYGTRLGAVYAAEFPDKVGRMVLDGVDTLTEPLSEQGRVAAEAQQTALEDFLDWCMQDIACPFGQDRREADDQVLQLVRSLDKNPVPTGSGGTLSGQDLVGAIGQALYSKAMWPSLERAIASLVQDGDPRGVEAFSSGGLTPPVGGRQARRDAPERAGAAKTPRNGGALAASE